MTSQTQASSVDAGEVRRFAALASKWWDEDGEFAALHKLNPVRIRYIRDRAGERFGLNGETFTPFKGLRVLDIGCGGGILAEPMARLGARVTGIDAGDAGIKAAKSHAAEVGLTIDYRHTTAEALAESGESFDIVLAMEVIEHVGDLDGFLAAAAALVAPGGLFFGATLNRTPKAIALAIVGAEYQLGWVPRGTHDWRRFVKPSELARGLRKGGLGLEDVTGVSLDLASGDWRPSGDAGVNYMLCAAKG